MIRIPVAAALIFLCAIPAGAQETTPPTAPPTTVPPVAAPQTVAPAAEEAILTDETVLAAGQHRSMQFLARDLESLWGAMTPEMQEGLGSIEAFRDFRNELDAAFGEEVGPVSEETINTQGIDIYVRRAPWSKSSAPLLMQWTFDQEGRISGFFVRESPQVADSSFMEYETKASLRLPFGGDWFVFWGGREFEQNYHAADKGQRFAYDFLVQRDGKSYSGDPSRPENYYCWGRPVRAPADGTVAAVVDGLPDQAIRMTDRANPAGNHVVLDLGNSEFAFLAHMRQGSIRVKQGDKVTGGQQIGECGNSGNTSEPHLHFHLQNTPTLGEGEGLPAFFRNYVDNGEPVERGEPIKGDTVAPQPAPAP
jgi:hypothetical protein